MITRARQWALAGLLLLAGMCAPAMSAAREYLQLFVTEPKATLVQPANRTEQSAYVGGGLRYYLTRRFFLRAEYKAHYIFTKRNANEEADEWKLGFAFFY